MEGSRGTSWLSRSRLEQGLWVTQQAPSGFPRSSMGVAPLPRHSPCSRCLSWAFLARLAMYRTRLWLREDVLRTSPSSTLFSLDSWTTGGARSAGVRGSTSVSLRSCAVRVSAA